MSDLTKAQAEEIKELQEETKRLNFLIAHKAYVTSDESTVGGYWLVYLKSGHPWVQIGEYTTPRAAIDAAMSQGEAL